MSGVFARTSVGVNLPDKVVPCSRTGRGNGVGKRYESAMRPVFSRIHHRAYRADIKECATTRVAPIGVLGQHEAGHRKADHAGREATRSLGAPGRQALSVPDPPYSEREFTLERSPTWSGTEGPRKALPKSLERAKDPL